VPNPEICRDRAGDRDWPAPAGPAPRARADCLV